MKKKWEEEAKRKRELEGKTNDKGSNKMAERVLLRVSQKLNGNFLLILGNFLLLVGNLLVTSHLLGARRGSRPERSSVGAQIFILMTISFEILQMLSSLRHRPHLYVQWRLKYQTCLDFEWSKVVRMLNGSDCEWHSKTEQPNHSKLHQIAVILNFYVVVPFLNGQDQLEL